MSALLLRKQSQAQIRRRCYVERHISYVTGFENEKPPSAFVTDINTHTYTHLHNTHAKKRGVRICSAQETTTNVTDNINHLELKGMCRIIRMKKKARQSAETSERERAKRIKKKIIY